MQNGLGAEIRPLFNGKVAEIEAGTRQQAQADVREMYWPAQATADVIRDPMLVALDIEERRHNDGEGQHHYDNQRYPLA